MIRILAVKNCHWNEMSRKINDANILQNKIIVPRINNIQCELGGVLIIQNQFNQEKN